MNINAIEKYSSRICFSAGFFGFLAVILGALGAHGPLRTALSKAGKVEIWETGVRFQMVHAVALLALAGLMMAKAASLHPERASVIKPGAFGLFRAAAYCWIVGIILFSGSLYAIAFDGPAWIGPVTPLGGLALMAGWLLVLVASWRPGWQG